MKKQQYEENLEFWLLVLFLSLFFEFLVIAFTLSNTLMLYIWITFTNFITAYSTVKAQYEKPKHSELTEFIYLLLITILLSIFVLYIFKFAISKYPNINVSVSVIK